MTTINVPSQYQIYQIAYLTVRGWRCDKNEYFTKDGVAQKVYDRHSNEEIVNEIFTLNDAYKWEQCNEKK